MSESYLVKHLAAKAESSQPRADRIVDSLRLASDLLPANGSLRHFRHHNPLRAFEGLPFDQAIHKAGRLRGTTSEQSERRYHEMLADSRIEPNVITDFLQHDLGCTANDDVAGLTTRINLRQQLVKLAAADAELSRAPGKSAEFRVMPERRPNLTQFHAVTTSRQRHTLLSNGQGTDVVAEVTRCLTTLWKVCRDNLQRSARDATSAMNSDSAAEVSVDPSKNENAAAAGSSGKLRHRDLLLRVTNVDTDHLVHAILIPFLSGFLDQGQLKWGHADREAGLLKAFARLYETPQFAEAAWLNSLPGELATLPIINWDALTSIEISLGELDISEADQHDFLAATLLALPGWTGIVHYLEHGAEWMTWPVPTGTLQEFMALRLILDRLATQFIASQQFPAFGGRCAELSQCIAKAERSELPTQARPTETAATIFNLAQMLGWTSTRLSNLTSAEWRDLHCEVQAFSREERLRCLQKSFELRYQRQVLDAVSIHATASSRNERNRTPKLQVVCCTDTCAESLRRHLEESCGDCETFGTPGLFGLGMSFRALGETHFSPHCPANMISRHYIQELPGLNSDGRSQRNPRSRVHLPGKSPFRTIELSSLLENWLSTPQLTRLLFPRVTRRLGRFSASQWRSPRSEQLDWQSTTHGLPGYTVDEMVDAVGTLLTEIGLTQNFAAVVLLVGHVSISANNPYAAAHNCSFCSGRSGGANARTMALMANDHRVRTQLKLDGIEIPDSTVFVSAEHDTCGDTIEYFDLTHLSLAQKDRLPYAIDMMDEALRRNAHERCRRFTNVSLNVTRENAAMLVEDRTADMTESCPEHSHVANAVCIVGRRCRTKGLFLDRRAFLASYDAATDDDEGAVLGKLLKTVIPTCAAVNLEYYFATMDPEVYGAGSKLRHSVVSMLGVTNGAFSDLCTGLPEEMVRLHEPVRLSCIIETTPKILTQLLAENAQLRRLFDNEWLFLATLDPDSNQIHNYDRGVFKRYIPQRSVLPEVASSEAWYGGLREHLSFATIRSREAAYP